MKLDDTVEFMLSNKYKERLAAEYWQLKYRYEKLKKAVDEHKSGVNTSKLTCIIGFYEQQLECMMKYLEILELRALVDDVTLEDYYEPYALLDTPVSVEIVEHGYWINEFEDKPYDPRDRNAWFKCSQCGHTVGKMFLSKYCPECGAKMDGEEIRHSNNIEQGW